jgi:hypothetical protein
MPKKRRNIILGVLAATFIVSACAPAPGVAPSAHWPAPVGTDVPEAVRVLERDAGGEWQALYVDSSGRTVLGTVGASMSTARTAHGRLCGWDWGRTAVLFEKAASKGCAGSSAPIFDNAANGSDVSATVYGNVTWFTDTVVAYPRVSTSGNGCAHLTWDAGRYVRVTYKGRSIVCRIHDHGPAAWTGNTLDLRQSQFQQLAPLSAGKLRGAKIELLAP